MWLIQNIFSAARDTELNKKFITGWLDEKNRPVCNYIAFAESSGVDGTIKR